MTKRQYLNLCLSQPTAWLAACAADPSASMTAMQVRIVRLAIRKKI